MGFNGTGTFLINSTGNPVVTGTTISSTWLNALTADLATGLTTTLTKDGQSTPTANIPLGGFKLTGVGVATTTGDALSYGRTATVTTLTASTSLTIASLTGVLTSSAGVVSVATAGTDYVAPGTATTFTAKQTFASASTPGIKIQNALEKVTISATAATGTVQYDVLTQSILRYTTNSAANWTLNVRGNGSTSLDSIMATGEVITIVFRVPHGASAFYQTALTIDGNAVTPTWAGGIAPTSGSASAADQYVLAITKTGSATFVVDESVTKFA